MGARFVVSEEMKSEDQYSYVHAVRGAVWSWLATFYPQQTHVARLIGGAEVTYAGYAWAISKSTVGVQGKLMGSGQLQKCHDYWTDHIGAAIIITSSWKIHLEAKEHRHDWPQILERVP